MTSTLTSNSNQTQNTLRVLKDKRPEMYDENEVDQGEQEQFLRMLQEYYGEVPQKDGTTRDVPVSDASEGDVVRARVVGRMNDMLVLSIGSKSEGLVHLDEFESSMRDAIQAGDTVEVYIEQMEGDEGDLQLSRKRAEVMQAWEKMVQAHEDKTHVRGKIDKKVKGGLALEIQGIEAFLPGSQIALRRVTNLDELLGQEMDFRVIKLNNKRRNIVVSRRAILEEERATSRSTLMAELEKDQIREGRVKNITEFGAFIDLGGVDGLLHKSDLSYEPVEKVSDLVSMDEVITVRVLDIDWERNRVSLGLKQLTDPWTIVDRIYPVGAVVRGKIKNRVENGFIMDLPHGLEAFLPSSDHHEGLEGAVAMETEGMDDGTRILLTVTESDPVERHMTVGISNSPAPLEEELAGTE